MASHSYVFSPIISAAEFTVLSHDLHHGTQAGACAHNLGHLTETGACAHHVGLLKKTVKLYGENTKSFLRDKCTSL